MLTKTSSTLKVSTLIQPSNRAMARHVVTSFPKALEYGPLHSKQADIDVLDESPKVEEVTDVVPSNQSDIDTVTPSTIVEHPNRSVEVTRKVTRETGESVFATPVPTSDPLVSAPPVQVPRLDSPTHDFDPKVLGMASLPSQLEDSLNTQSSNVHDMKNVLKAMMLPEHISQGDTQTQVLAAPPPLSESTGSPDRDTISPSRRTKAEPTTRDKPTLSPTKASELRRDQEHLRQHARDGRKTKKGEVILCQCGHAEEEDDMVSCMCCGTWQHLHCYGYAGSDDPRLPEEHACYQCLLGGEEQLLERLKDLALKRRGMHMAVKKGAKSQRDFAEDMGEYSTMLRLT